MARKTRGKNITIIIFCIVMCMCLAVDKQTAHGESDSDSVLIHRHAAVYGCGFHDFTADMDTTGITKLPFYSDIGSALNDIRRPEEHSLSMDKSKKYEGWSILHEISTTRRHTITGIILLVYARLQEYMFISTRLTHASNAAFYYMYVGLHTAEIPRAVHEAGRTGKYIQALTTVYKYIHGVISRLLALSSRCRSLCASLFLNNDVGKRLPPWNSQVFTSAQDAWQWTEMEKSVVLNNIGNYCIVLILLSKSVLTNKLAFRKTFQLLTSNLKTRADISSDVTTKQSCFPKRFLIVTNQETKNAIHGDRRTPQSDKPRAEDTRKTKRRNTGHTDATSKGVTYKKGELYNVSGSPFSWLNSFESAPLLRMLLYPVSQIHTYLDDLVNNHESKGDLMNHEWARYESFKDFPKNSVMPLRMAQAGFYYTGVADEVACFHCHVTYKHWKYGDNASVVHSSISPGCRFLNGQDKSNMAIYESESEGKHEFAKYDSGIWAQESTTSSDGACGFAFKDNKKNNIPAYEYDVIETDSRFTTDAKYPAYSEVKKRQESFDISWEHNDVQNSSSLAEAGFYYAGFGDCTRCFYCGVGLRNWDSADCPRDEHKRWSPVCRYLLQGTSSKARHEAGLADSREPVTENETNDAVSQQSPATVLTDQELPPVSDVMVKLLEMGFTQEQADAGICRVNGENGTNITTEDVIEEILKLGDSHEARAPQAANASPDRKPTSSRDDAKAKATSGNQSAITKSDNRETVGATNDKSNTRGSNILMEENRILREQMLCKICMDADACVVTLPCGHMVSCPDCARSLRKCPICRRHIKQKVKAFIS